jgi:hypothetical protein
MKKPVYQTNLGRLYEAGCFEILAGLEERTVDPPEPRKH